MRNETPPEPVKRSLACLWVLPDHPVLLAGSRVVVRCNVCLLDKIGDAEPKLIGRGFLGKATAHDGKDKTGRRVRQGHLAVAQKPTLNPLAAELVAKDFRMFLPGRGAFSD